MDYAFTYLESNALEYESEYPYTGRDGTCGATSGHLTISSYVDVAANSPTAL